MSSLIHNQPQMRAAASEQSVTATPTNLIGGIAFDWAISLLGMVFLGGLFLDGWAHNHDRVDQSFFTPWHAFFYSGYALIALLLVATLWVNHRRGAAWNHALPTGYAPSMLGVLIFAAGGVGDLIWHETFGIEKGIDALFSPTHLILAIGLNSIVTGPLRAAWARPGRQLDWRMAEPLLLSLTGLISGLTFLLMASHPLAGSIAGATHHYDDQIGKIAGSVGVLITTALLVGPLLLVVRRWQLPAGSVIVVWGINTLAMFVVNWHHDFTLWQMLAMVVAIVVIEIMRLRLEPLHSNRQSLRLFAALAPFLLIGSYFLALHATEGTRWSIHLWTGVIVEAGLAGWLLSYLVVPPTMPVETEQ